jgi:hypothetical protein
VGGGEGVLIETFAAGGAFALVPGTVIGSATGFVITARVDDAGGAASEEAEKGASSEKP